MDIIKKAVEIEAKGENLYREMAGDTENDGLKEIFNFLAGEEAKHREIFRSMASEEAVELPESEVNSTVKGIFKKMSENSEKADMEHYEIKIYRKALKIEQKSIDYYTGIMDKVKEEQKDTLRKIIGEEKKHYRIIENIIEFANRPQQWLDDAEWYHLEEY